jgi:hypothetical protein
MPGLRPGMPGKEVHQAMDKLKNLAAFIEAARLMLAGLAAHVEQLGARGLDAAFLTALSAKYQQLLDSHGEQQALKARLMEKTRERQAIQRELLDQYREARKTVKIALPNETWREFGISDRF